ncbi:MAG: hypothetical protein EOP18_06865 [Rhizobiaceae bacterium]|nr:MAG: hypothetical protein EOP18_06865 [Rhizobiaceae bacterium]
MSNDAVSIALSEEERLFVDSQIAAGNYADDVELLHAGLAALEREQRLRTLRALIAEGDADIARGDFVSFETAGELSEYIKTRAETLRRDLIDAEASGASSRRVPDIMNAVKTKLRTNGSL